MKNTSNSLKIKNKIFLKNNLKNFQKNYLYVDNLWIKNIFSGKNVIKSFFMVDKLWIASFKKNLEQFIINKFLILKITRFK